MQGSFLTEIEGIRGGNTIKEGSLSTISLDGKTYSQNYIQVKGKEYSIDTKKLEVIEQEIKINQEGKIIFKGTFEELCNKLSQK